MPKVLTFKDREARLDGVKRTLRETDDKKFEGCSR